MDKLDLVGKTLKGIEPMSKAELKYMGWFVAPKLAPPVLVFEGGVRVFASRDSEGNGPGVLMAKEKDQSYFVLLPRTSDGEQQA